MIKSGVPKVLFCEWAKITKINATCKQRNQTCLSLHSILKDVIFLFLCWISSSAYWALLFSTQKFYFRFPVLFGTLWRRHEKAWDDASCNLSSTPFHLFYRFPSHDSQRRKKARGDQTMRKHVRRCVWKVRYLSVRHDKFLDYLSFDLGMQWQ